jgi:hypothetical protein
MYHPCSVFVLRVIPRGNTTNRLVVAVSYEVRTTNVAPIQMDQPLLSSKRWRDAEAVYCHAVLTESLTNFVVEEKAIFQNSQIVFERTKIWPRAPTERETKNDCAGEGRQQVPVLLRLPGLS